MKNNFSASKKPKQQPYLKLSSWDSFKGIDDFLIIGIIFLLISFFLLSGFFL